MAAAWPLLKPGIMPGCTPTRESCPFGFCTFEKTGAEPGWYADCGLWYGYGECCGFEGIDGICPCETAGDMRDMDPPALIGLCCWLKVGEGPVE